MDNQQESLRWRAYFGSNGSVGIRTDNPKNTFRVEGVMRAWDYLYGSDRSLKTDFRKVDGTKFCSALEKLPVSSWRLKKDKKKRERIGPMAQDVKPFLGMGTGKTLSLTDTSGITLVALKEY